MKYAPHDPEYWEHVDIKQVEYMEKQFAKLDQEYIDEIRDPMRSARGVFAMMFLAVIFWGGLCFLVAAVNTYIGGG